jgi:hypothetical protein
LPAAYDTVAAQIASGSARLSLRSPVVEDDAMLTTAEAADAIGVSVPYLTRLFGTGRPPSRVTDGQPLIPLAALRAFKLERDRTLHELSRLAAIEERLGVR